MSENISWFRIAAPKKDAEESTIGDYHKQALDKKEPEFNILYPYIGNPIGQMDGALNRIRQLQQTSKEAGEDIQKFMKSLLWKEWDNNIWDVGRLAEAFNRFYETRAAERGEKVESAGLYYFKDLNDLYDLLHEYAKLLVINNRVLPNPVLESIADDPWRAMDFAKFCVENNAAVPEKVLHGVAASPAMAFEYVDFMLDWGAEDAVPAVLTDSIANDLGYSVKAATEIIESGNPAPAKIVDRIATDEAESFELAKRLVAADLDVPAPIVKVLKASDMYAKEYLELVEEAEQELPAGAAQEILSAEEAYAEAEKLMGEGKKVPEDLLAVVAEDPEHALMLANSKLFIDKDVPYVLSDSIASSVVLSARYARTLINSKKQLPLNIMKTIAKDKQLALEYALDLKRSNKEVPKEIIEGAGGVEAIERAMAPDDLEVEAGMGQGISQIDRGTEVEMEHSKTLEQLIRDVSEGKDIEILDYARKIAEDHLKEDPRYYSKLDSLGL